MRLVLLHAAFFVVFSSCKGGSGPAETQTCGDTACQTGQACCVGCDGQGLCVQPGAACPGVACPPSEVLVCDGVECADQNGSCCIDCDGSSTCIAAGATCPGAACGGTVCTGPAEFDQSCETPADCSVVTYDLDCCGGGRISAVNSDVLTAFVAGQAPCVEEINQCPPLGCSAPMTADDGSEVSGPSQVNIVCTDLVCRTVSAF
jgi:hypothetical protein